MSCNQSVGSKKPITGGDCIADIVKDIVKAQRRAVESGESSCLTGCDQSIADLLSPTEDRPNRSRHNTIPFILTCSGSCKPYFGSGIRKYRDDNVDFFECVESPIFRAKSFVKNSDTCVRLELLTPVNGSSEETGTDSVCDFLPSGTSNFQATGICVTVDLSCFCGISCLDAITPASI